MSDYYKLNHHASISFKANAADSVSLEEKDVVEITGDYEVNKPAGAGSIKVVGTIQTATETAGGECLVIAHGYRIDKLISGAAVAVGAVVLDGANKVIQYNSGSHDSAAIIGQALQAATGADEEIEILFKI